ILGQIVAIGEAYIAENVGLTATNQLRADLMLHCLRLDPVFYTTHTPGELIERVDGDVHKLSNFFSRLML
ncbi:MAG TPA: ABC transporter ATP-binding protein, partial [Ktedonobacter sp.]|nr:ABC transporter ATP-binding protein [Ktedonobacter sp.]